MQSSGSSPGPADLTRNRKRAERRTAVACTFCRQRKTRCSGGWPQCSNCKSKRRECHYPGLAGTSGGWLEDRSSGLDQPPPLQLRTAAISFFRDNYANTLLCFLPPQQFIEDPAGDRLPQPLLLCILALTLRFLPEFNCSSPGQLTPDYSEAARSEVTKLSEQPSIIAIQCYLILCVVEVGDGLEHRAWLHVGHAVRLSQLARLHKEDMDQSSFDWGLPPKPARSGTAIEERRRTFWCMFCLERLLANGRDRIATLVSEDITTHLPKFDDNFIFEREQKRTRLSHLNEGVEDNAPESLFSHTIRIVDILSKIMLWQGRGGRRLDKQCPWLSLSPFGTYARSLALWRRRLPSHWEFQPHNISLVVAAGQGKLWSLMFMFYFQAKTCLYREYLPFTPSANYDPTAGPADNGPLLPPNCIPPFDWWRNYTTTMVESAESVAHLFKRMDDLNLAACVYPFVGLGLFTAASVHVVFSIFEFDSLGSNVSIETAKKCLKISMCAFNTIGQYWDLPVYWIRQISLYYKLNYLTMRSITQGENISIDWKESFQDVKDGVMNYLRQLSSRDRETSRLHLKSKFDFDGWLTAVESSSSSRRRTVSCEPASPVVLSDEERRRDPGAYDSLGWTDLSTSKGPHMYFSSIFSTDPWDALSLEATSWDHPGGIFMGAELTEPEQM